MEVVKSPFPFVTWLSTLTFRTTRRLCTFFAHDSVFAGQSDMEFSHFTQYLKID